MMVKKIFFLSLVCFMIAQPVWAGIEAKGYGATASQALNSALQQAVESVVGAHIRSQTVVKDFQVVKDEIITHAKGYVSSYTVINQGKDSSGTYFIKINAEVKKGLIIDSIESLEILMKMTGHPKVLIFGIDDDMDSISAVIDEFKQLTTPLVDVFREKFRFDVLDWNTLRADYKHVTGKLDRRKSIQFASQVKTDFAVMAKLNFRSGKCKLILEGVRISDKFFLGREDADFMIARSNSEPAHIRAAIHAAGDHIFPLAVRLARKITEGMQREAERGKGFRYTIVMTNFPKGKVRQFLDSNLNFMNGYVRHNVARMTDKNLEVAYWSNLKTDELFALITKALNAEGYKYKSKLDGRMMKFKWLHPDFD